MSKALENLTSYFANKEDVKEEIPAGKAAEMRHMSTDALSYVTWFKSNKSEYFTDTEVKLALSDLASTYEAQALLYYAKPFQSEWQQQQYQSGLNGYNVMNQAIKELGKAPEGELMND